MAGLQGSLGAVVQEGDDLSADLAASVAGVEFAEGLGHISDHGRGRHRGDGVLTDRVDDAGQAGQRRVREGGGDEGGSVVKEIASAHVPP